MNLLTVLTLISGTSFIYFGISCLTNSFIKSEFKRFGLKKYRVIIGYLQLIGALGLFFGYSYSLILQAAAALGLAILMLMGFIVRIKIRDTINQCIPSLSYALINGIILLLIFYK